MAHPIYEYTARERPALLNAFEDDEALLKDGWKRIHADITQQGAYVTYRREMSVDIGTIPTLPPPPAVSTSTPKSRPAHEARDIHRAAYRVRRILAGEEVAGVSTRLAHDYQLVHAVLSGLSESHPLMTARGLVVKWRQHATRLQGAIEALSINVGAPRSPGTKQIMRALKRQTEECTAELSAVLEQAKTQ
jgi:hypothetical protein